MFGMMSQRATKLEIMIKSYQIGTHGTYYGMRGRRRSESHDAHGDRACDPIGRCTAEYKG